MKLIEIHYKPVKSRPIMEIKHESARTVHTLHAEVHVLTCFRYMTHKFTINESLIKIFQCEEWRDFSYYKGWVNTLKICIDLEYA